MNPGKVVPVRGPRPAGHRSDPLDSAPELGPFEPDHIYQGDALDLLSRIPPGSVDLVVTDPPFAIDFQAQRLNYNRTGGHVMEGYREIPPEEYAAFTREWVGQAYQALAPTGSIYLFSGWNRLRDVLTALDDAGFVTLNHLIWKYQFGVFTRRKFVTSHYHILYAVKNPKEYTFHKIDHYPEDVWVINREYWKGRKKTPTSSLRHWSGKSWSIPAIPVTLCSIPSSVQARSRRSRTKWGGISSVSRSWRNISILPGNE